MGAVGSFARHVQPVSRGKPERLAALTRLRALLIGWVVLYHLELTLHALDGVPAAERIVLKGYLGVDGFFLLSGFALYLGYRHRPPLGPAGWRDFVLRRAARIFPLHLAALSALLLLVGAAAAVGLRINDPQRFGMWELGMQALLMHAWETTRVHAWNYPSWALSAIWAGYLVFPLVLTAMIGSRRVTSWIVVAACLAGLGWLGDSPAPLNRTLHLGLLRFGVEFLLGIAVARLASTHGRGWGGAAAALLLPVGLALQVDAVAVAGLAGLVAWLGTRPAGEGKPDDLAWRLGEASFGVYLSWVFVEASLVLAMRVLDAGPGLRLALMGAGLVATFALGWLAWRFVELPAARRLERVSP